jgi:glucose-1-phosphate thymidylyltransferase
LRIPDSRIAKAIILARGLGLRMRSDDASVALSPEQARAAAQGLKAMIPVGRPFLDYVLSGLADAGVRNVCLVIGPEHDQVRDYYTTQSRPTRVMVEFAVQHEATGTADALLAAREFAATENFLVLNADNYYPVESYRALILHGGPGLPGFDREALVREGNIDVARIQRYALLRVRDGWLEDIVEKPDAMTYASMGEHALVSMNLWSFSPVIFDACERVSSSSRGELELPEAVRIAVHQMGIGFRVFPMQAGVLDLSSRPDVASVAELLKHVEVRL